VLDREVYEARNLEFYEQYKAGTLDIHEFLDFQLKPLSRHPRSQLDAWHSEKESFPKNLENLLLEKDAEGVPVYLESIPAVYLIEHALSNNVKTGTKTNDEGGWLYNASNGRVSVNCTHTDTKNIPVSGW